MTAWPRRRLPERAEATRPFWDPNYAVACDPLDEETLAAFDRLRDRILEAVPTFAAFGEAAAEMATGLAAAVEPWHICLDDTDLELFGYGEDEHHSEPQADEEIAAWRDILDGAKR